MFGFHLFYTLEHLNTVTTMEQCSVTQRNGVYSISRWRMLKPKIETGQSLMSGWVGWKPLPTTTANENIERCMHSTIRYKVFSNQNEEKEKRYVRNKHTLKNHVDEIPKMSDVSKKAEREEQKIQLTLYIIAYVCSKPDRAKWLEPPRARSICFIWFTLLAVCRYTNDFHTTLHIASSEGADEKTVCLRINVIICE